MIEIRIPKEIRSYEETFMLNLSFRKLIAIVLMLVVNVPMFVFLQPYLGVDLTTLLVIITALPFGGWGWFKYNGMNFEQLVEAVFVSMFLYPSKRLYETENLYTEIHEELKRTRN